MATRSAKYDPISFACSDSNYLPTPGGIPVNNDFGEGGERSEMTNKESREREKENRLKPIIPADSRGKKKVGGRGEGRARWVFALILHRLKFIDRMLRLLLRQGSSNL